MGTRYLFTRVLVKIQILLPSLLTTSSHLTFIMPMAWTRRFANFLAWIGVLVVSLVVNQLLTSLEVGKLGGQSYTSKGTSSSVDARPFLQIPNATSFCLVHVGKTAGSKVKCELGLKNFAASRCSSRPWSHYPSSLKDAYAAGTHMRRAAC
jgi:hypothetical protein